MKDQIIGGARVLRKIISKPACAHVYNKRFIVAYRVDFRKAFPLLSAQPLTFKHCATWECCAKFFNWIHYG